MNIDNLEFTTHFNGHMDVHKESCGTILDLHVNGNLLCYQSWTQAASPLNSKKRKAFGLPPSAFVKAIDNFHNTNRHKTLYTPTLSLKIGDSEDLTIVTCVSFKLVVDDLKNQILRLNILTNFEDINLQKNINFDSLIEAHGNKNLKVKGLFSEFRFYHLNHDEYFTNNNIVFAPHEQIRDKTDLKNSLGNRNIKVIKNKFLFNDICNISYDDNGDLVLMVDNEEGIRHLVMHQCWNEHDLLNANIGLNRYLSCVHPSELERIMTVLENYIRSKGLDKFIDVDQISYRPTCIIDINKESQSYLAVLKSFKIINELDDNILNSRSKLKIVLSLKQIEGLKKNKPPTGNNMDVFIHMDSVGLMMTRDTKHPDGREIVEDVFGNSHVIHEDFYVKDKKWYSTATNRPYSEQWWNMQPLDKRPDHIPIPDWLAQRSKSYNSKSDYTEPNNNLTSSKHSDDSKYETTPTKDGQPPMSLENFQEQYIETLTFRNTIMKNVLSAVGPELKNLDIDPNTVLGVLLGDYDKNDNSSSSGGGNTPVVKADPVGDVLSDFVQKLQDIIDGNSPDGDLSDTAKWFKKFGEGLGNFILMMGAFEVIRAGGSFFLTSIKNPFGAGSIGDGLSSVWSKTGGRAANAIRNSRFGFKGGKPDPKMQALREQSGLDPVGAEEADAEALSRLTEQAKQLDQMTSATSADGSTTGADVLNTQGGNESKALNELFNDEGLAGEGDPISQFVENQEASIEEVQNAANQIGDINKFVKAPETQPKLQNVKNTASQNTMNELGTTNSREALQATTENAQATAENLANQGAELAESSATAQGQAGEAAAKAADAAINSAEDAAVAAGDTKKVLEAMEANEGELDELLAEGEAGGEAAEGIFASIRTGFSTAVDSVLGALEGVTDALGSLLGFV